jgi:hypothetical protein
LICVGGRGDARRDAGGSAAATACGMWAVREGAMAGRVGGGGGGWGVGGGRGFAHQEGVVDCERLCVVCDSKIMQWCFVTRNLTS